MAAWQVVPALEDLRVELNTVAPNRDKSSDGSIGDQSHASGRSSHNPDKSGNPEWRDGDSKNEVRARDFDKDLRQPGLTMDKVVEHLVKGCRAGRFWWIRYIIWEGYIYHKRDGYVRRKYTGSNKHDQHVHVNNDFSQAADNYTGAKYNLASLLPAREPVQEEPVALTEAEIEAVADAVWAKQFGTTSTGQRFSSPNQAARNYLMLGAIYGYDAVKLLTTQAATLKALDEELDVLRAAVGTDATEEQRFATMQAAIQQALADAQTMETAREEMLRAELNTEISMVPSRTIALLGNPATPDEQVADALVSLLGNRREAIINLMQSR